MNWTVGPLPPAVYWRRRAIVAAPALVLLISLGSCLFTGDDGTDSVTVAQTKQDGSKNKPYVPVPSTVSPSASVSASPSVAATAPASTSPSALPPTTAPVNPPAAAAPPAAPAGPQFCGDRSLTVKASSGSASYQLGQYPRFTMVITNTTQVACQRDVGARQQELLVMQGSRRIWSSDDCAANNEADVRTLQPGESRRYYVGWDGTSSAPGCKGVRHRAPAGSYQVVGRLTSLQSAAYAFTIKK